MPNIKKQTKLIIITILTALILFTAFLIWSSASLTTTFYDYKSSRVPQNFDGMKIVQLSDIHCKSFGKDNQTLINAINELDPDIIFITGDSIDKSHKSLAPLDRLFAGICDTAPIYAISGNHENDDMHLYSQLISLYDKYGITDLDDSQILWTYNDEAILIKGLGAFQNKINWDRDFMESKSPDTFSIILDHYPQLNLLARYSYDIALSGHIHGGVIRIPYLGGLIGNRGNLFPEYDGGMYSLGNTTMYVSRGIGDTVIPRINNKPEIVCITLHHID